MFNGLTKAIVGILFVTISFYAPAALSEVVVTDDLKADLMSQDMTVDSLASWMQNVLDMRGHPCSEVFHMGGKVPVVSPDTRRNVMIVVTCEENTYSIKVGVGRGWTVDPV